MKNNNRWLWIVKGIAALIMLQTLYFKFSAQPESVKLFTLLDMEPWGRIGIGVAELIASVLLLIPATAWLGAIVGIGLMGGAIFFHITKLGISFGGSPLLFMYAVIVLICCSIILYVERKRVPVFRKLIR